MIPPHGAYVQEHSFLSTTYASRARSAVKEAARLAAWKPKRRRKEARETVKLIRRIAEAQEWICPACDDWIEFDPAFGMSHPLRPSIDHVVPRSKGGGNYGNVLVLHRECNCTKSNRMPNGCEMIWLASVNARLGVLE